MRSDSWSEHWGNDYDRPFKMRFAFGPLFKRLEGEGKLGQVIVDIGSGAWAVSEKLAPRHTVITIDLGNYDETQARAIGAWNRQYVPFDIEDVEDSGKFSTRRALLKIASFLDVDPRREGSQEQVDTMIFSEVLNYVDYQQVLRAMARYLKKGGRFIIYNLPTRGIKDLFSSKGLKSNIELLQFLESEGFEVEMAESVFSGEIFPIDFDTTLVLVVARKR